VGTDEDLGKLTSKSVMLENGWEIDVSSSNEKGNKYEEDCSLETFYGYKNSAVGNVSALLKGRGIVTLSYGNCYKTGYVLVSLNGIEIGRATSKSQDLVSFQYGRGDVLKIEEFDTAIIKLYFLHVQSAGKKC
jgi:hypothetical protein